MSDPSAALVIASVTAVLRDRLANGLVQYSSVTHLGDVTVSVLPPDRINVGADEPNQLNLFMYRVAPHSTLRKAGGADRERADDKRGPQMLGLDLHYLLTAYGGQDFHSEILLGCAVHLLGSMPVLTSGNGHGSSQPVTAKGRPKATSPVREALAATVLDGSVGDVRISQEFMTFEDMSKLWSVLQARYRPSVTYEVSAVRMALTR